MTALSALIAATHHGHWFPFVPLFFLGLWLLVFFALRRRWCHPARRSGESVLAERYARGEIDEQEFQARRAVLRKRG